MLGPCPGEDAAVVDFTPGLWVVTSDPITFKTPRPGYYAVHINANDIAVMGARPRFFTFTLIAPTQSTEEQVTAIVADVLEASNALGAVLIGGHSEVSEVVNAPLISLTMLGDLIAGRPFQTADGLVGDAVIQVNPMAIEGTSILASEFFSRLEQNFGAELVGRAAGFLYEPGLSVVGPAHLAARHLEVHAMHDPTEGGIATGLREIAKGSGAGLEIHGNRLLIAPETRAICDFLGYDPLGLISSGCLLFTVASDQARVATDLMLEHGYPAAVIGTLTPDRNEFLIRETDGGTRPLPDFAADELAG